MAKEIPLTRGLVAIVDDEDFEMLMQFKWRAHGNLRRGIYAARGRRAILMHRQIMDATPGTEVDHRDRDCLNNRRTNLRIASHQQNMRNQDSCVGTSRFKGVSWHKGTRKWVVQIGIGGRRVHIGLFNDEEEAAKAYDEAAIHHFGEFARTNRALGLLTTTKEAPSEPTTS